jgi:hypothetical protein
MRSKMQTFIEFVKELDPNFNLDEGCCPACDCDPCTCGKKKDKGGDKKEKKNPFMKAKEDKGEDKEDKKEKKNPFMKFKDKGKDKDED